MAHPERIVRRIRAAFVADGRLNVRSEDIHVGWEDGVVLSGRVERLADKRLAEHIARVQAPGTPVHNRLTLRPATERPDHEIETRVRNALDQDPNLNLVETAVEARHGVVTLRGLTTSLVTKRIAEATAWWTEGVRDVRNLIEVSPPEEDHDREITEAVVALLEKDPLVDASEVIPHTDGGIVILQGVVCSDVEKDAAENDAWYVSGVRDVLNALYVAPARTPRERTDFGGHGHGTEGPGPR